MAKKIDTGKVVSTPPCHSLSVLLIMLALAQTIEIILRVWAPSLVFPCTASL